MKFLIPLFLFCIVITGCTRAGSKLVAGTCAMPPDCTQVTKISRIEDGRFFGFKYLGKALSDKEEEIRNPGDLVTVDCPN